MEALFQTSVQTLASPESTQRDLARAVGVVSRALAGNNATPSEFVTGLAQSLAATSPEPRAAALTAIASVTAELQRDAATAPTPADWCVYAAPALAALTQRDSAVLDSALAVLMPVAASPALRTAVLAARPAAELAQLPHDVAATALARGPHLTRDTRLRTLVVLWALATVHPPSPAAALELAARVTELYAGQRDAALLHNAFMVLALLLHAADAEALRAAAPSLVAAFADYYPILAVPPGAPVGRAELAAALRACFAASGALAACTLPLLLDKAASTVVAARVDAFDTLAACVVAYGRTFAGARDFLVLAAACVCDNGCLGASEALARACFGFVAAVDATFGDDGDDDDARTFVATVVDGLTARLLPAGGAEPYDTEACACARAVLAEMCAEIPRARAHVPACLARLAHAAVADATAANTATAAPMLAGCLADCAEALATVDDAEATAVLRDGLLELLAVAASAPAVVVAEAGRWCAALATFPVAAVDDAFLATAAGRLLELARSTSGARSDVRATAFAALGAIAAVREDVVLRLVEHVDFAVCRDPETLRGFAVVACASPAVFRLFFRALATVVTRKGEREEDVAAVLDVLTQCLADGNNGSSVVAVEQDVLDVVTHLLTRTPPVARAAHAFVQTAVEHLTDAAQDALLQWLRTEKRWSALVGVAVASLRTPAATAAVTDRSLVDSLLAAALSATGDAQTALAEALAALYAHCTLSDDAAARASLAQTAAAVEAHAETAPALLCCLARALLLRDADPLAAHLLDRAVTLCLAGSDAAGRSFAAVFGPAAPPMDDTHRARVFAAAFAPLLAALQQQPQQLPPPSAARALAAVLDCTPAPAAAVAQVTPHALAALAAAADDPDADLAPVLALVRHAVVRDAAFFHADHERLARLVTRLGALATHSRSAQSRAAALAVLRAVPQCCAPDDVRGWVRDVRRVLAVALDDPKRPVRHAAVLCGSAWDAAEHPCSYDDSGM